MFGQAGKRLLDISDLPKTLIKRDPVRTKTLFFFQQVSEFSKSSIKTLDQIAEYIKNYQ